MPTINIRTPNGEFKKFPTAKGDDGLSLEFVWNGTQLGVRREGDLEYQYVNLKGESGDGTGDMHTSIYDTNNNGIVDNAEKVNNHTVESNVPAGAKFTDTNTTYDPVTTTANGLMLSTDKVKLDGVENNANNYTHPAGTNPHGTTKADVGLGNVTNDKQMPISGGELENYREKLVTVSASGGSVNLSNGNVFTHTPSGDSTYVFSNAGSGAHSFTLVINMGATLRTLTFPSSVKWQDEEVPDLSTGSKTYVLTFLTIDSGTTWLGMFGGSF